MLLIKRNVLINREIYQRFRATFKGKPDIHTRLMMKYKDIPNWWFHITLALSLVLSLVLCIFMKDQVQLSWWGLLLAAFLALIFTLPISIITATTNMVSLILQSWSYVYFHLLMHSCLLNKILLGMTVSRTKCDHGIYYWYDNPRVSNSQCVLQDFWLYEYEPSCFLSPRF